MTEPTLTRPDGSPVRVLIVDDEPLLADLLAMAMTTEGWSARTANDGQVALRLAREFHPDVVVLDVMMPHVDGLQVVSRLRERGNDRSEEHTSELQSRFDLVCRLLLETK